MAAPLHMDVDAGLVELVDERFAAIKRQHFPSYVGLLQSWGESLKSTEEWIVKKEQEFAQSADTLIAQYQNQRGPTALQDHNYCSKDEESACWRRVFMLRPHCEGGSRQDAYYSAPCGRRLRSMEEVHQFLESTSVGVRDCNISITNFTFDPLCSLICPPYNAKDAGAKVFIPDVACGAESIPITCVNTITSDPPEHFNYINQRTTGPGVHIESDPGFLVSCSCTDNCTNRSKCECWRLTVQEAKMFGPTKHSVGYAHGRLKRPQRSAIYECNLKCSCGPKCGNRVVQKGVEHHLQVFRTEDRGWGLRTLRDIPAGSFICTYVGQIFPEHTLEGEGGQLPTTPISDEYFAELDYIEVVEHHKEGYESEVECHSDSDTTSSSSEDDSFHIDSSTVKESTIEPCPSPSSENESDTSSSSTLSIISLCSSLISPLHSPSLSPGAVATVSTISPTTTYTVTSSATSNVTTPQMPHPETGHSPIVSRIVNMPSRLSVVQHISTDVIVDGSQPIIDQSSDGMTQLPTHETVSTDRPALTFPTTPTSNRTSHPRTGYRMMSPRDYVVPISPRKLHGMRTRQHFSEDFSYIIDAKEKGNIGRYINHSCSPNMFVQNVFVDTHDLRFPWVAFFARNRIKSLQELTWDYSYEVGSVEGKVIFCRCKAPNCRGRLI